MGWNIGRFLREGGEVDFFFALKLRVSECQEVWEADAV